MEQTYVAIDLKSFYASVECRERGLDPLTTYLVVADQSRTDKTICLAVSPALKSWGIPGRPRLFEVIRSVQDINARRKAQLGREFTTVSYDDRDVRAHPDVGLVYQIARPRMALYLQYSTKIYGIYLRYVAPEDIHVYSIDEVLMDVTAYLGMYGMTARELAERMVRNVLQETGITATVGIGTNLYLAKVAMDIVAKHLPGDSHGMRIASLNELSYRQILWQHRPLTDFWRIGRGIAQKLEENGLYTMKDIALLSRKEESFLYKLFGIQAELLIDHSWGYEPCTIEDIKRWRPQKHSVGSGQVLHHPYDTEKARLIVWEMAEALSLELVDKGLVTEILVLTIGYDRTSLKQDRAYTGEIVHDSYGRAVPRHAHGTIHLGVKTASTRLITEGAVRLYDRIIRPGLWVRRVCLTAERVDDEKKMRYEMDTLFDSPTGMTKEQSNRERRQQHAILHIQKRFGKNAVVKGRNLEEGATTRERNEQIGGHRA